MNIREFFKEAEAKFLPKPVTREQISEIIPDRIQTISKEFTDGFSFIKNYPKSVTIFGSSRVKEGEPYYDLARTIGHRIVTDLGYSVFTGGGPGLMEAGNRGALEAKGQSLGLTIRLPEEQSTNGYVTAYQDFYYFFSRKVCLSFSAEAYVFLPGGFGTLDEFFEILTLIQTHKIEKTPLILAGSDFWGDLDYFIKKEMIHRHFISETDTELYTITDDVDRIIDIIRNSPINTEQP